MLLIGCRIRPEHCPCILRGNCLVSINDQNCLSFGEVRRDDIIKLNCSFLIVVTLVVQVEVAYKGGDRILRNLVDADDCKKDLVFTAQRPESDYFSLLPLGKKICRNWLPFPCSIIAAAFLYNRCRNIQVHNVCVNCYIALGAHYVLKHAIFPKEYKVTSNNRRRFVCVANFVDVFNSKLPQVFLALGI
jgi:hypothetical protein